MTHPIESEHHRSALLAMFTEPLFGGDFADVEVDAATATELRAAGIVLASSERRSTVIPQRMVRLCRLTELGAEHAWALVLDIVSDMAPAVVERLTALAAHSPQRHIDADDPLVLLGLANVEHANTPTGLSWITTTGRQIASLLVGAANHGGV